MERFGFPQPEAVVEEIGPIGVFLFGSSHIFLNPLQKPWMLYFFWADSFAGDFFLAGFFLAVCFFAGFFADGFLAVRFLDAGFWGTGAGEAGLAFGGRPRLRLAGASGAGGAGGVGGVGEGGDVGGGRNPRSNNTFAHRRCYRKAR